VPAGGTPLSGLPPEGGGSAEFYQIVIMAKSGSKKGACSANVQPAKANCLQHARREGKIPSYVNPHLTHTNRVVFEGDIIRGRKSILPLLRKAEKLYSEKTRQKCQKSFTPFREDVLHIKAGVTDEQLMNFKAKAEELTGWKVVGIWLHQDEGHVHSKYIEGDEDFAINYHAHVLYDCQNHETGKAIRLGRDYFRKRQDVLAECTGMERGNPASETGILHRKSQQQRIHSQEQRIQQLEGKKEQLEKQVESLEVSKVAKEKTLGFLGIRTTKDTEIEHLKNENKALETRLDEEAANHTATIQRMQHMANEQLEKARKATNEANKNNREKERLLQLILLFPIVRECREIVRSFVRFGQAIFNPADTAKLSAFMGETEATENRKKTASSLWELAKYSSGSEALLTRWHKAKMELLSIAERKEPGERLEKGLKR